VCGIIGYIGSRPAASVLIEGLRQLEYRGYDSFGIAVNGQKIGLLKRNGRIPEDFPEINSFLGTAGIGHTRWATHGIPSDRNAHPHLDCSGRIAVVHNGIIENYLSLKKELEQGGHCFQSETDSEVIPHLIEEYSGKGLLEAVRRATGRLTGSYAFLVIEEGGRGRIIAAKKSSPLVIGCGDGEMLAASDATPILDYTERVIYLEDDDIASISPDGVEVFQNGCRVERPASLIEWSREDVKRGGFPHFMEKEIFEQPEVLANSVRVLTELPDILEGVKGLTLVACGSSFHAGLIFKYLLERVAGIPVRCELASEFKYHPSPARDPVIAVTQSGETADTNSALQVARSYNCPTIAITNVLGSSVTRIADMVIFLKAGPEISVAATKSFIAQCGVLARLADLLSGGKYRTTLLKANVAISDVLRAEFEDAVDLCSGARSLFYIGRGAFYPVALEGALKMKEISYIHAEGFAAGEIKHGPFALLSEDTPVIAVCPPGETYEVMNSNIKEIKARGTPVIVLGRRSDREISRISDLFIPMPEGDIITDIMASTVILQLLAYRTAVRLGREIDRPKNLAKCVTVE
jgi:glucosamine--fructose-6-phosphate aminotransferase (isomerizing)